MIVENLNKELSVYLPEAQEVHIAVALAKEKPLETLLNLIPNDSQKRVLVGVDLPTSIEALQFLKENSLHDNNFKAAICHDHNRTFHPKVYLVKHNDNWLAFIGSANLTEGGLTNNVELSYLTMDQAHCLELLTWFDKKFSESFPINDYNMAEYKKQLIPEIIEKTSESIAFKFKKSNQPESILSNYNFTDRFFKKDHHLAFRKELSFDNSPAANQARHNARDRFLTLHEIIYPSFYQNGLGSLYCNVKNHIVSMPYHIEGRTSQKLDAMWLSYGKSQEEIKKYKVFFPQVSRNKANNEEDDKQSFINHARLQIRIEIESIGIWLLFGKNNEGSLFDRQHFSKEMRKIDYRNEFFQMVQILPMEYWIRVNDIKQVCNTFHNPDELYNFCRKDDSRKYFIIGRDYKISDDEVSEANLPNEAIMVFRRLLPFYEMMRHRF
jgi:HKD family nuclease